MKRTWPKRLLVIALATMNYSLILWSVASGRQLLSIEDASASSLAFSPDGKMIATGSGDGTMKFWDVGTGKELRPFAGHDDWHGSRFSGPEVNSLTFSPDGKTLLAAARTACSNCGMWQPVTCCELLGGTPPLCSRLSSVVEAK